jgi:DNA-binding SARP family transcriptional activator
MAATPESRTVVTLARGSRSPSRPPDGELLTVTLLGGFVLGAGTEVVELPTGMQRLVAVLALRGRTSRSRLAGTLWPDTTEHRALASLRTGIWRLNQVAGRLVVCTGGTVDLGPAVLIDVRRLVDAATAVLRAGAQASLDDAHAILDDDGELLPDWEDEWLSTDRERLRQLRLHVLEAVADRLTLAGCFGLALEAGLAALRADGLRESAHRTLIRIHLAEGNVAEARRAFEHCRDVLTRDVGVEPSAATRDLVPRFGGGQPVPAVAGSV